MTILKISTGFALAFLLVAGAVLCNSAAAKEACRPHWDVSGDQTSLSSSHGSTMLLAQGNDLREKLEKLMQDQQSQSKPNDQPNEMFDKQGDEYHRAVPEQQPQGALDLRELLPGKGKRSRDLPKKE